MAAKKIEFNSIFKEEISDYIKFKRSLGFKYDTGEIALKRIDRFFIESGVQEKQITKELCDKWSQRRKHETQNNQNNRIAQLRGFTAYLSEIGIDTYVIPKGITKHAPKIKPYLFTSDELKRFFEAVDNSQAVPGECPYRDKTMPVFFRLLYTSGFRVSELRLAKVGDFDLEKGFVTVNSGKNHKDRLVPINPDVLEMCRKLKKEIHAESSDDEYFFMVRPGAPITLQNAYKNFRRYLEKANISHGGRGKGPRIHDFRHLYCVNMLKTWSQEGKDLVAWLPYLRTVLGHESFNETAYYLKLTAELYPWILDKLKESYPNIVEEIDEEDPDEEFY